MATYSESEIKEALRGVNYPGFSRDIISFGILKSVESSGSETRVVLEVSTADDKVAAALVDSVNEALRRLDAGHKFMVELVRKTPITAPPSGGQSPNQLPGVRHVIAVASGKGGVGKSTVAANLACALLVSGARVGLCDCDLYGPSISLMFGTREQPMITQDQKLVPVEQYGLKLLSLAFLTDPSQPAVLRGPMVTRYTQQFLLGTDWAGTDYLILDLPPGTGDIQLTIVQSIALAGAVIVTTPQEVALIDARKAIAMFEKVNTRVLGLVENMSHFICPNDGNVYPIFGKGGGRAEAERLGVPLLAEVPLDMEAREAGDHGQPIVLAKPGNPVSKAFLNAAGQIRQICPIS